jgi:hypothetical protein
LRYRLDHGLRLGRRGRRLGLDEGLRLHRELRHVVELRLGLGLGHRRSLGRGLEDGRRLLQIIPDTLDVDVHLATLQLRAGLVVAGRRLQGLGPGADFRLVGLHLARRLGRCPLDVHHLVDAGRSNSGAGSTISNRRSSGSTRSAMPWRASTSRSSSGSGAPVTRCSVAAASQVLASSAWKCSR